MESEEKHIKEAVDLLKKHCSSYEDFRIKDNCVISELICVMVNKIVKLEDEIEGLKK